MNEVNTIRVSADNRSSSEHAAKDSSANEPRTPSPTFRGVPTNFRASYARAREGGTHSYYWVGRSFTAQLESNIPYDLSFDEWDDRIGDLHKMISTGDNQGIWNWLQGFFPRCMQLVPRRRREQFLQGVYAYAEEEWIL